MFLDIEESDVDVDGLCQFDWLTIHDGPSTTSPHIHGRYCGTVPPADEIVSTANVVLIHFRSDPFGAGAGFRLDYYAKLSNVDIRSGTELYVIHN